MSITGPSDTEDRGYWVFVPKNYDPTKPYKVIYSGAGCDDPDIYNAGKDGYPYQTVNMDSAIQVGLDYDTHSVVPLCYDNRNDKSNDFAFMPIADGTRSRTTSAWTPATSSFRGTAAAAGWLSSSTAHSPPSSAAWCRSPAPSPWPSRRATLPPPRCFIFTTLETAEIPYQSFLPGCTRVLKQNGCSVTDCSDPQSTTLTSPVHVARGHRCSSGHGLPAIQRVSCRLPGRVLHDPPARHGEQARRSARVGDPGILGFHEQAEVIQTSEPLMKPRSPSSRPRRSCGARHRRRSLGVRRWRRRRRVRHDGELRRRSHRAVAGWRRVPVHAFPARSTLELPGVHRPASRSHGVASAATADHERQLVLGARLQLRRPWARRTER